MGIREIQLLKVVAAHDPDNKYNIVRLLDDFVSHNHLCGIREMDAEWKEPCMAMITRSTPHIWVKSSCTSAIVDTGRPNLSDTLS